MAKVGEIALGGRESGCGVAFQLSAPAPLSHAYASPGDSWEVEMRKDKTSVIARTSDSLGRSDVLAVGLEHVQRCLDLLSFEKRENLHLERPGDDHIVLFMRDGTYVLQQFSVVAIPVGVNVNVVVTDKDGSVVAQKPAAPSVWTPGLRFYRLSQVSTDLYDAYRSLWLGLESLLDTVCPQTSAEREREWLLRALSFVGSTVDLKNLVPSSSANPVAYIVGTQYDDIRCRIFHSKGARPGSHPDVPDPEKVASAYEQLIRVWREIAERCLSIRSAGGGAMTYAGFRMSFDKTLDGQLGMYFTDDASPCTRGDVEVSPAGHPVFPFAKVTYLSETAPGRVSFVGSQSVPQTGAMPVVHRICSKVDDQLFTAWSTDEGLYVDGVDCLESYQTCRLVNRYLPRTVFN